MYCGNPGKALIIILYPGPIQTNVHQLPTLFWVEWDIDSVQFTLGAESSQFEIRLNGVFTNTAFANMAGSVCPATLNIHLLTLGIVQNINLTHQVGQDCHSSG